MAGSELRVVLIFLVICAGLGLMFRNDLQTAFGPASRQPALDALSASPVYDHLKIAPLGADLAALKPIATALNDLTDAPCDKSAIFRLSNELAKAGQRRIAANALMGFANACPNSEGELSAAANMLFGLGDYAAVVPVADRLLEQRPNIDKYYYLRGQALVHLGRSREAVDDLSSAIALFDDIKLVSSQAFEILASAYAADGKPCQAMTAIQTYVYADASTRDIASRRKLIAGYADKGKCDTGYADGAELIPRPTQGVTFAKVSINGIKGTFIIDTGASVVSVDTAFAEKAKLTGSGKTLAHTANGVVEATLSTAASVELGKVRAANVAVAIMAKPLGKGIDGLLGMSFLARFDVTLGERGVRIKAREASHEQPTGPN